MIPKKNKKKKVYDGKNISVNIFDVTIKKRKFQREIIEQGSASGVLAFEGTKVILVKQHRFPLGYVLEIGLEYGTYSDTVTDMICGLIGGLFAMCTIQRPVG